VYGKIKHLHFVGIGGIGMSGIAEILINMGYRVTGSDLKESETVKRLMGLGARVHIGHSAQNVHDSDVVVISSAVRQDNPEVIEALSLNIPVIPRAQMLAELMRLRYGIAVAGSHGKTTTTSMIEAVLSHGGLDPTIVVGGKVKTLGTNARLGQGNFMVVEADESDGSFLLLSPVISVLTNIDEEHMDHYKDMEDLENAFTTFLNKIPFYGLSVLCLDCPRVSTIASDFKKRMITYGFNQGAELRALDVKIAGFETEFTIVRGDAVLGSIRIHSPGKHNAQNALAAIAVGLELGMSFEDVREGLSKFEGIDRRMQIKGSARGITVVDDYAHHPREIEVTIEAIKETGAGRLVVMFQPHRYSRTSLLFDDFVRVLMGADKLYLLDIYAASEDPIEGVSSEKLYDALKESGHKDVTYINGSQSVVSTVLEAVESGDTVLTLGAGNVWTYGEEIAEGIK
jgi:UDP-N-acetylmuramate--alanine ligase